MTRTREENAHELQSEALRREQDARLSPEQLDDKYNPDGDGEQPDYTREEWRQAVANEDTISGYWVWVEHMLLNE